MRPSLTAWAADPLSRYPGRKMEITLQRCHTEYCTAYLRVISESSSRSRTYFFSGEDEMMMMRCAGIEIPSIRIREILSNRRASGTPVGFARLTQAAPIA